MKTFHEEYYDYTKKFLSAQKISDKHRYVMYPNGNIATIVREVLIKEYNITPAFIVDNNRYDGKTVYNLSQASLLSDNSTYYLICSDKDEIYNDIRENLKKYIDNNHIIDLFPRKVERKYIENVNLVLDSIDNEIREKVCI